MTIREWVRENERDLVRLNLTLACLIPVALLGWNFWQRALPWWSDGGNWLKHMHALLGEDWPMWGEGAFQYPPLYFLLLALVAAVTGEGMALKLTSVVIFSLSPIPIYILTRQLFNSKLAGVASAWLASLPPVLVEMIGWGGYPNLLGLLIMPVTFYFVFRAAETKSSADLAWATLCAVLVMLSHHLTFLIMMGTLALWLVSLAAMRRWKEVRFVAIVLFISALAFGAYRVLLAWPVQFIISNEQAYYTLNVEPGVLLWLFKDNRLLFLLFLISSYSALYFLVTKRNKMAVSFLLSWVATPVLLCSGHLIGIALDYMRIFAFIVQPLMILVASSLSLVPARPELIHDSPDGITSHLESLATGVESILRWMTRPDTVARFILVAGATCSVVLTLATGVAAVESVNLWYNGIDRYGDGAKIEATNWIRSNTGEKDVFVAQEQIARWIEGLGQRRVVMHQEPMYLFMVGELEREVAARAILLSQRGIVNGKVWVADQSPWGTMAPLISFYREGWYSDVLFVDAYNSFALVRTQDGRLINETLSQASNVEVEWIERSEERVVLRATYSLTYATVERNVIVNAGEKMVTVEFVARPVQGASVASLTVHVGYEALGVTVWGVELLSERTLRLSTNRGQVCVRTTSDQAFPFVFRATGTGADLQGTIEIYSDEPGSARSGLTSYSRDDYVDAYQVKYVVVPREFSTDPTGLHSVETRTNVLYQHLLEDESLRRAYENSRLIILEFVGRGTGS